MKIASLIIGILPMVWSGNARAQEEQTLVFKEIDTANTFERRTGVFQSLIDKNFAKVNESIVTIPVGANPQAVAVNQNLCR